MTKKTGTTMGFRRFRFRDEGMEKRMETIIMGYIGATIGIHSFIPS